MELIELYFSEFRETELEFKRGNLQQIHKTETVCKDKFEYSQMVLNLMPTDLLKNKKVTEFVEVLASDVFHL